MELTKLRKFDFPEGMISGWQNAGIKKLLPIQQKAIERYALFEGKNLIVSAPTSSGKTFIGELAAIYRALHQGRAVYLVPTKALAEEKYRSFSEFYKEYSIKVVISSRDHKDHDFDLSQGDFQIAVVVYEKFVQLLVNDPSFLSQVKLVIVDELQLLADTERGPDIELLLTRLKLEENRVQIIGLSAVIGNSGVLPEWLNAEMIEEHRRPVELRIGYISDGIYQYRTFNDGEEGSEEISLGLAGSKPDQMIAVTKRLSETGEQCLVFLPDKASTRIMAGKLSEELSAPCSEDAIMELQELEESNSRDLLITTLRRGIAFHNSDLSPEERNIVEKYYRKQEIRVLVSTTTLAMGVNLPAKNVLIDLQFWKSSAAHQYYKDHMRRSDFDNIAGRAGRFGLEADFGRAITIAASKIEKEQFRRIYWEGNYEHIKPQLWEGTMATAVMTAVGLGGCITIHQVKEFLQNSLSWKLNAKDARQKERLEKGIRDCLDAGILINDGDKVKLTVFGEAAAGAGIKVETAWFVQRWLTTRLTHGLVNAIEVLFMASVSEDGLDAYLNFCTSAFKQYRYSLRDRIRTDLGADSFTFLENMIFNRAVDDYIKTKCIRNAYLYRDYISGKLNREIEDRNNLCMGSIRHAGEHLGWVISAFGDLAKAMGYSEQIVEKFRRLSEQLQYGIPKSGLELARLRVAGLGRERINVLVRQGLEDLDSIKEMSQRELSRWVTSPVAQRLIAKLEKLERLPQTEKVEESVIIAFPGDRLEMTGQQDNRRMLIRLNDRLFGISEKSFEALLRLAIARLEESEGWIDKNDLGLTEGGITQGISRLRESLLDFQQDQETSIIENDNRGHYRLTIPASQIVVNWRNLREHWSTAIRDLAM